MTTTTARRGKKLNLGELAEFRGVVVNTILAAVRRGAPYVRRGRGGGRGSGAWLFNSKDFVEWEIAEAIEKAIGGNGEVGAARETYWRARARREQLEVAKMEQGLVPAEDFGRFVESLIVVFRSRLLGMPRKLAHMVAPDRPAEAERKLDAEVRAILTELASSSTCDEILGVYDADPEEKTNGVANRSTGASGNEGFEAAGQGDAKV